MSGPLILENSMYTLRYHTCVLTAMLTRSMLATRTTHETNRCVSIVQANIGIIAAERDEQRSLKAHRNQRLPCVMTDRIRTDHQFVETFACILRLRAKRIQVKDNFNPPFLKLSSVLPSSTFREHGAEAWWSRALLYHGQDSDRRIYSSLGIY